MKLTYKQYADYILWACDEELARLEEYIYHLQNTETDISDDKPWTVEPESLPSMEYCDKQLAGRDFEADLIILSDEDADDGLRCDLYEEIRNLILYS